MLTTRIKRSCSRTAVLLAFAAWLLTGVPARACVSFNVEQIPLAAGGAGTLVELTFTTKVSAEAISKGFVGNSAPDVADTSYIFAGNSLFASDGRALNLNSAEELTPLVDVIWPGSRFAEDHVGSIAADNLDSGPATGNINWIPEMCVAAAVSLGSMVLLRRVRGLAKARS